MIMALINILVAVNASELAERLNDGSMQPGSVTNPTNLGAWTGSDVFISMITQNSYLASNQGGSELDVKANSGDSVRWNVSTFDGDSDYTAYLYNGNFTPSASITALSYFNMHTSVYLPSGSDPVNSAPALFHNNVYATQGTVIEAGQRIQYTLCFKLVNNSTGAVIGCFTWDPFISISN
jgi:nematocidal protein AidA